MSSREQHLENLRQKAKDRWFTSVWATKVLGIAHQTVSLFLKEWEAAGLVVRKQLAGVLVKCMWRFKE